MADTVSIVVPCFDTAAYLDECLQSLVGQTYRDVQIVAVDDGSSDGTAGMLDAWSARDERIVVVHQENRGLGAARNTGLRHATGAYLTFVDSDDKLPLDALQRMVSTLERTGSDFVTGVAARFDEHRTWRASLYRRGFREDLDRTHVFERPSLLRDHIICSKLFRRSFWDSAGLTFPEGTLFEDIEIATRAHCLAERVDILVEPTYLWRERPAGDLSITQDRLRPGSVTQRFEALTRTDHYVRDHAPENVWRRHSLKVLATDIRLYLHFVPSADDRFVEEYASAARAFLQTASPRAIAEQGHLRRRLVDLLIEGDVRSIRAMSAIMGPRAERTMRSRFVGAVRLRPRDQIWLARVGITVAAERVRATARRLVRQRAG